jgi:hypothetical protein
MIVRASSNLNTVLSLTHTTKFAYFLRLPRLAVSNYTMQIAKSFRRYVIKLYFTIFNKIMQIQYVNDNGAR